MRTEFTNEIRFAIIVFLIGIFLIAMALVAFFPERSTAKPVPVGLESILTSDYSMGVEGTFVPAIRLDILQDILRDLEGLSQEEVAERMATVQVLLLTPVPVLPAQQGNINVQSPEILATVAAINQAALATAEALGIPAETIQALFPTLGAQVQPPTGETPPAGIQATPVSTSLTPASPPTTPPIVIIPPGSPVPSATTPPTEEPRSPKVTNTLQPTLTRTMTPTSTQTVTSTVTATPTVTSTSTVTPTTTVTMTPTTTATVTPTPACSIMASLWSTSSSGKTAQFTITNNSGVNITISEIKIDWPSGNGNMTLITLDGTTIYSTTQAPTSATINSGWAGGIGLRKINASNSGVLQFTYLTNAAASGYDIDVNFDTTCSLTVTE